MSHSAAETNLKETLGKFLPATHDEYGGPLVSVCFTYEDGSKQWRDHHAVDRLRTALHSTPEPSEALPEGLYWMVERNDFLPHAWYSCKDGGIIWTDDATMAVRFADKESGQLVCDALLATGHYEGLHVTEHLWAALEGGKL